MFGGTKLCEKEVHFGILLLRLLSWCVIINKCTLKFTCMLIVIKLKCIISYIYMTRLS